MVDVFLYLIVWQTACLPEIYFRVHSFIAELNLSVKLASDLSSLDLYSLVQRVFR